MTRRSLFSTFFGTLLTPLTAKFFPPPLVAKPFPSGLAFYKYLGPITNRHFTVVSYNDYLANFHYDYLGQPYVTYDLCPARPSLPPRRADVGAEKSTRLPGPQGSPPPA